MDSPTELSEGMIQSAARLAAAVVPAGPRVSRAEGRAVVAILRRSAQRALTLAAEVTELQRVLPAAGQVPVRVVTRAGWLRAAGGLAAELLASHSPPARRPAASQLLGVPGFAAALAAISPQILGQFNPFVPGGELLLVAPNIVRQERAADYDIMDYRLWVCLHEQTHNLQSQAAPWLAPHLRNELRELLSAFSADDDAALEVLWDSPRAANLFALLAFLEGHAEVVMDAVGPTIIPSIKLIRARTQTSRLRATRLPGGLGKTMGEKMRQYRQGAQFVRAVLAECGHGGLAPLWASAANAPTAQEIADPPAWLARVAPPPTARAPGGHSGEAHGQT